MINKITRPPEFLIVRYNEWKSTSFLNNQNHFKKLSSVGQNPSTMVISCCDSRVHATSIFGANEGEFFIHRNIANLVPPYSPDGTHHGTSAAIEYGTKELKINHLIILGHTDCGGIISGYNLHTDKPNPDYEFINKWLSIIKPAYKKISTNISKKNQIKQLEEESVKNSINNLFSFPNIKKEVESKKLSISGLIHDIGSGQLRYLSPLTKKFKSL
jgi:carbonic anhydrase